MTRILLFFGNSCTTPKVNPSNWNKPGASIQKDWYIFYRFNGKLQCIKGMNGFHNLADRKTATQRVLDNEIYMLKYEGYNPITKQFKLPDESALDPFTPFNRALEIAYNALEVSCGTKNDIKAVKDFCKKAATRLEIHRMPVSQIKRRHVKSILELGSEIKQRWTPNTFNAYRKYLMILFEQMIDLEAIEYNPAEKIRKKQVTQKIRITLTKEERVLVSEYLFNNYFNYWRYLQIFFHSGSRTSELFRVKKPDIDIENQKYKCMIRKGRKWREVWKTIKDIALPHWKELFEMASEDDFIFSDNLVPGPGSIRPDQITKRWKRLVKDKLGIKADFYSLKHSNTTETVDILDEQAAAKMNGHTSTAMVVKIYDTKRSDREHERLKGINNPFA